MSDQTNQPNTMRRRLRRIAHHLSPVVTVGEAGVSAAVVAETNRALRDHELIKVRIHSHAREDRAELGQMLADQCGATPVQTIGKVLVLYRANPEPNPNLSNVLRFDRR